MNKFEKNLKKIFMKMQEKFFWWKWKPKNWWKFDDENFRWKKDLENSMRIFVENFSVRQS